MLEMKGIDKRFGAVVALNKASLTVENGQIGMTTGSGMPASFLAPTGK